MSMREAGFGPEFGVTRTATTLPELIVVEGPSSLHSVVKIFPEMVHDSPVSEPFAKRVIVQDFPTPGTLPCTSARRSRATSDAWGTIRSQFDSVALAGPKDDPRA